MTQPEPTVNYTVKELLLGLHQKVDAGFARLSKLEEHKQRQESGQFTQAQALSIRQINLDQRKQEKELAANHDSQRWSLRGNKATVVALAIAALSLILTVAGAAAHSL